MNESYVESCAVLQTVIGDLDGVGEPEVVAALRVRIDGHERTEWQILRREDDRLVTLRMLYDAEGFTPSEGAELSIRDRRILGRGEWNCSDCGCTSGSASIMLETAEGEPLLVLDPAGTHIESEAPVCDDP